MSASFGRDLVASNLAFDVIVRPQLIQLLGGGAVYRTSFVGEGASASAAVDVVKEVGSLLDMHAGIDAVQEWPVKTSSGRSVRYLRGIAVRVQFGEDYRTFTVRRTRVATGAPTEWDKLLVARQYGRFGWLVPALHVQAYVAGKADVALQDAWRLLSLAAVYTDDLVQCVRDTGDPDARGGAECAHAYVRRNGVDGNTFWVVSWHLLDEAQARIRTWIAPSAGGSES